MKLIFHHHVSGTKMKANISRRKTPSTISLTAPHTWASKCTYHCWVTANMCRVMTDAFRYVGAFLFTLLLIHFYSFLVLFYISYSILFYSILASSFSFTLTFHYAFSFLLSFPPLSSPLSPLLHSLMLSSPASFYTRYPPPSLPSPYPLLLSSLFFSPSFSFPPFPFLFFS